jgi:hypothetical protein
VIRRLELLKKELEASPKDEKLLAEQQKFKSHLLYINNYPPLWKYLSLFPTTEPSAEIKKLCEETYAKVLKMAEAKSEIREKELYEADNPDEKIVHKNSVQNDDFFAEDSSDTEGQEKRAVMRDGRVPKLQKNFDRIQ